MSERERLIRIIENSKVMERCGCHYNDVERYINEIVDYLLNNGAIVPPCKVGDAVYFTVFNITDNGEEYFKYILKGYVVSWAAQGDGLWAYCLYDGGLTMYHKVKDDFGETVFLTKKEAEKALEE